MKLKVVYTQPHPTSLNGGSEEGLGSLSYQEVRLSSISCLTAIRRRFLLVH